MEYRGVKGSPQEVKNFFKEINFDAADILKKELKEHSWFWVCLPCFIVVILLICSAYSSSEKATNLLLGGVVMAIAWTSVSVQIKFKNWIASSITGLGLFLASLVGTGEFSLSEAYDEAKSTIEDNGQPDE